MFIELRMILRERVKTACKQQRRKESDMPLGTSPLQEHVIVAFWITSHPSPSSPSDMKRRLNAKRKLMGKLHIVEFIALLLSVTCNRCIGAPDVYTLKTWFEVCKCSWVDITTHILWCLVNIVDLNHCYPLLSFSESWLHKYFICYWFFI